MSSSGSGSAGTSVLIFAVFLIIAVVFRAYRTFNGTRVSVGRTIGYTILYVALGVFFVLGSFIDGLSPLYVLPDAVVLVLAAVWTYRLSDKRIYFWKEPNGEIYYKGGIVIYGIWVLGLVARLAIDYLIIGPAAFSFGTTVTQSAMAGFIATDLILLFGVGLLFGRNLRVYKRFNLIQKGVEQVPSAP